MDRFDRLPRGCLCLCTPRDSTDEHGSQGVRVEQDPDEYSTDLGKTVTRLSQLESSSPSQAPYQLVIIGGLSGRLDQTVHTLHALTLLAEKEGRERVWTVGRESAAVVLKKVRRLPFSSL